MSATVQLKPCPFCGRRDVAQGASRDFISVWCFCGVRGPEVPFPQDCDPLPPILKCYEAWNRRTPDLDQLQADKAALVEALTFYRDGFVYWPKRTDLGINLSEWKPTKSLLEDCGQRADALLQRMGAV